MLYIRTTLLQQLRISHNMICIQAVCWNGLEDIAELLLTNCLKKDGQDIKLAFRKAIRNNHVLVAKWLVAKNEAIFLHACANNRKNIVAWFEQDFASNSRYFYHKHQPYIINHAPIPGWRHRKLLGCPIAYRGKFDEKAVLAKIATIHSFKSARSAKI